MRSSLAGPRSWDVGTNDGARSDFDDHPADLRRSVEVFAVLRNRLEQSLYAYFIFKSPDRYRGWSERHENPEALKAVRRLFVVADRLASVAADHPDDGSVSRTLHEAMIDWGRPRSAQRRISLHSRSEHRPREQEPQ